MVDVMSVRPQSFPVGIGSIVLGVALVTLGRPLDGFVGGFTDGAGIAMILLGALVSGRRRDRSAGWLPSRDEEPRG
jgi:hypothetical protein